jgi:cell division protein ZapA
MPRYTLTVLGVELSFITDADADRINKAKALIEEQYRSLNQDGKKLSKEKLLTVLALSLADDYLQCDAKLARLEKRINGLMEKMD